MSSNTAINLEQLLSTSEFSQANLQGALIHDMLKTKQEIKQTIALAQGLFAIKNTQVIVAEDLEIKFFATNSNLSNQDFINIQSLAETICLITGLTTSLEANNQRFKFVNDGSTKLILPSIYPNYAAGEQLIDLATSSLYEKITFKTKTDIELAASVANYLKHARLDDKISLVKIIEEPIPQIVLRCSLARLIDKNTRSALAGIVRLTGIERVKIIPDHKSLLSSIKKIINNKFPWQIKFSEADCKINLALDQSYACENQELLSEIKLICVGNGLTLEVFELDFVKSGSVIPAKPSLVDRNNNLFSSKIIAHENSNVIEFYYNFPLGKLTTNFIIDNFSNKDKIQLHHSNIIKSAPTELFKLIENICSALKIEGIEINKDRLELKLTEKSNKADYKNILVLAECVQAINQAHGLALRIFKLNAAEDFQNFFYHLIPNNLPWSFSKETQPILLMQNPEKLDKEILRLFKTIFNIELKVLRDKMPIPGKIINSIALLDEPASLAEIDFHLDTIRETLPSCFGSNAEVTKIGNRIIIFTTAKNIPESYIAYYQARLYAVNFPVYLIEESAAALIDSMKDLLEIATHSLPDGYLLHKITNNSVEATAEVYTFRNKWDLTDWAEKIQKCTNLPFKYRLIEPSFELRNLVENSGAADLKKVFARIISPKNYIQEPPVLESVFQSLLDVTFSTKSVVVQKSNFIPNVSEVVKSSFCIDPLNAKLHEDCFSIEELSTGGKRIGIHVLNVADVVPFGSIADVQAYFRKIKRFIEIDDEVSTLSMLPESLKQIGFGAGRKRFSFSLFVETDSQLKIIDKSFEIKISEIDGTDFLVDEYVDTPGKVENVDARVRALRAFIEVNAEKVSKISDVPSMKLTAKTLNSEAIVMVMLGIFNRTVEEKIKKQNLELPSFPRNLTKFNTAAREYLALISQRALSSFLGSSQKLTRTQVQHLSADCKHYYQQKALINLLMKIRIKSLEKSDGSLKIRLGPGSDFKVE